MVLSTFRVHCLMSHWIGRVGDGIVSVKSLLSYKPFKWEERGMVLSTLRAIKVR